MIQFPRSNSFGALGKMKSYSSKPTSEYPRIRGSSNTTGRYRIGECEGHGRNGTAVPCLRWNPKPLNASVGDLKPLWRPTIERDRHALSLGIGKFLWKNVALNLHIGRCRESGEIQKTVVAKAPGERSVRDIPTINNKSLRVGFRPRKGYFRMRRIHRRRRVRYPVRAGHRGRSNFPPGYFLLGKSFRWIRHVLS